MKQPMSRVTCIGMAALLFIAAGCASSPKPLPPASWAASADPVVALQPGDLLRIQFTYWPELNTEQAIRPDGKIALQLVGDVMAQGLDPEALRAQLNTLYATEIKDPEITVVVASYNSHRVYISGEVRSPGVLPLQTRLTLLEAIMQSGGVIKQSAQLRNVILIRQIDGKQCSQSIDLRKAFSEPESESIYLQPGDIVFVPRTVIDRVDQFVAQYINDIIPRSVYFNITRDLTPNRDYSSNNQTFQVQMAP